MARTNHGRAAKAKAPGKSTTTKKAGGATGTILDSVPYMSEEDLEEFALNIAEAERNAPKNAEDDEGSSTDSETYVKGMSQMML